MKLKWTGEFHIWFSKAAKKQWMIHCCAFDKEDKTYGCPNDIHVGLGSRHLTIRLPFQWWPGLDI